MRLTAGSFGLAVAAAVFLLVVPVYWGSGTYGTTHRTLLEVNGSWVLIPVMFPVLVAVLPLMVRRKGVRMAAAILMGAFVVVTGFSIGLVYLPAALAMWLAACMDPSAKLRDLFR